MERATILLAAVPGEAHRRPLILAIFALTYVGLAMGHVPGLKLNRVGIVLLGAIGMMLFGGVTTAEAVSFVNWPTILLLFGFFVISAQLQLSGFYNLVANAIAAGLGHPAKFLAVLMAATGGLSAFLNHDIVCFVFTPVAATALLRKGLNPVPFLIGLAIASNIGAAATVIGNPQDMLIAEVAQLGFGQYLAWSFVPTVFALAAAYGIIWMLSRHSLRAPDPDGSAPPADSSFNRPHTIKGLVILVVAVGLLFTSLPKEIIALAAAGIHLASPKFRTEDLLGLVDWSILVLFMGLFVVTGALQATGYGDAAVQKLAHDGFNVQEPHNLMLAAAGLSNVINNSAAVMLLLKVVHISQPVTAYVLALANSFGGSFILVGSLSNIIVVQQARQAGVAISFRDFARLGIPVTLAAFAGLVCWLALAG